MAQSKLTFLREEQSLQLPQRYLNPCHLQILYVGPFDFSPFAFLCLLSYLLFALILAE